MRSRFSMIAIHAKLGLPKMGTPVNSGWWRGDMTWIGPAGAEEVEVPDLIGLIVSVARIVARDTGLVIAAADPDGPPLAALTWPGAWVVVSQRPPPGATLRRNGTVVVDCQQWPPSDEVGDREPRRPLPHLDVLGGEPTWTEDIDLRGTACFKGPAPTVPD
jgi:hypothetical protein